MKNLQIKAEEEDDTTTSCGEDFEAIVIWVKQRTRLFPRLIIFHLRHQITNASEEYNSCTEQIDRRLWPLVANGPLLL